MSKNNMKKKKSSSSVWKTIGQILLISTCLVLLLIGSFAGWLWWKGQRDKKIEQVILKEFYADVKNNPEITVKRFMLWEGDSIADIDIKDKGHVNMWYGDDNVPIISTIGDYSTSFGCYYVDKNNKKLESVYSLDLDLDHDSEFRKWFPFEVNTLKDLVVNYDDIIAVLKTFPSNPELIEFKDKSGQHYVRKTPDRDFMITTSYNNRQVQCDLYTQVYQDFTNNLCNDDSDCLVVPKPEADNKCCSSCDVEVVNKSESENRNNWQTKNCKNAFSMCVVHDCYTPQIPVAKCIAGSCQLQWKDR